MDQQATASLLEGTVAPGLNFKEIQYDLVNSGSNLLSSKQRLHTCVGEKFRDGLPHFILTSGYPLNGQEKFEFGLKLA